MASSSASSSAAADSDMNDPEVFSAFLDQLQAGPKTREIVPTFLSRKAMSDYRALNAVRGERRRFIMTLVQERFEDDGGLGHEKTRGPNPQREAVWQEITDEVNERYAAATKETLTVTQAKKALANAKRKLRRPPADVAEPSYDDDELPSNVANSLPDIDPNLEFVRSVVLRETSNVPADEVPARRRRTSSRLRSAAAAAAATANQSSAEEVADSNSSVSESQQEIVTELQETLMQRKEQIRLFRSHIEELSQRHNTQLRKLMEVAEEFVGSEGIDRLRQIANL